MWPVAKSGEPEAKRMRRAVAFGEEENPLSRGLSGPLRSSKSGKPEAKRMRRDVAFGEEKKSAEPGPERPAAKQQERKNGSTSVETRGYLCVRALRKHRLCRC